MLRTIERASELLKLFTIETPEWGISDLAEALDWRTSTTYDLVFSLVQIGFLKQSSNRRYKMGWRALELSQVVLGSSTLQSEARKGMQQFSAKYDETIFLGVMAGGKILYADKIAATYQLPADLSTPFIRFPAHCTAAGKVIMSHMSIADRQDIFDEHGLDAMTPKSIHTIATLNDELARVKSQGHAYVFEELILGLGSVAAPVFDHSGQVVAALSITAAIQQFERHLDKYRSAILHTAQQVSRGMGHLNFGD